MCLNVFHLNDRMLGLICKSWDRDVFRDNFSIKIGTVQIQFGVCQKWKSYTIEVLLTFYYYNKTL